MPWPKCCVLIDITTGMIRVFTGMMNAMSLYMIKRLVGSMRRRCTAVVCASGGHTCYLNVRINYSSSLALTLCELRAFFV